MCIQTTAILFVVLLIGLNQANPGHIVLSNVLAATLTVLLFAADVIWSVPAIPEGEDDPDRPDDDEVCKQKRAA